MASTEVHGPRGHTHTRRHKALAVFAVMALLAVPTASAGGGLLGDVLDDILDPIRDLLDPVLDPILGEVSDIAGIPLDDSVDDLLDGAVDDLIGPAEQLILPDDGAPLAPPDFDDLAQLAPLEPIDPLIEDVLVPEVLDPAGDALAPIGDLMLPLGPVSTSPIIDAVIDTARPALEPLSLDAAAYVVEGELARPDGTVSTVTHQAVVDVPRGIDLTGDGIDDVSVELRFLTAQPSLRVIRLPGAPSELPGAVRATLAPNGWSAPERLSVGFSAIDDDLPALARVTVTDLGATSDDLAAAIHTTNPGAELTLTASVYEQGTDQNRIDPTDVTIGFSPVPVDATVAATGVLAGFESGTVSMTASEPTRVDAAVSLGADDGDSVAVGVLIDDMPGAMDLAVTRAGDDIELGYSASGPVHRLALKLSETAAGITRSIEVGFEGIDATTASFAFSGTDLTYDASAAIQALTVEIIDPTGIAGRATELRARLEGLPDTMDVDLGDGAGSTIGFDAGGGTLGLLEIQLTSGPDLALDPSIDGVMLEDVADHYVLFARITDLRSVRATTSAGLDATLSTLGGRPFLVTVTQDAAAGGVDTLAARLSALPSEVTVTFTQDAAGTALNYTASGTVPHIDVDVTSTGGISGNISDVRARLTSVPTAFSAGVAGDTISFDAGPDAIGTVDLLASDGTTSAAVPDGVDGLVLTDTPAGFAAAARITGIRSATFSPDPLTIDIDTTGARVFEVDATQADADGSGTDIRATIDRLPSSVTLSLADQDGSPHLDYAASAGVDLLMATVTQARATGGVTTIDLEVHDLPTELSLVLGETIEYTASATVPSLRADITDSERLVGLADRLHLQLVDLPSSITFGITDAGALSYSSTGGALGSLDALLTSGPELGLPVGTEGVLLVDEPDQFVASAHVTGLRSISFDPTEGAAFSLGTLGGQIFELDVRQAGSDGSSTEVRATLDRLPADVSVSFSEGDGTDFSLAYAASAVMDHLHAQLTRGSAGSAPTTAALEIDALPTQLDLSVSDGGTVSYTASSGVPRLALDVGSPDGIFGRATELHLQATDLPTGIDATVDPDGGLVASTTGGSIGVLEVLITSGAEIGLDGSVDGLVLRDTADVFAVFARITGVSGIQFTTTESGASIALDTDASRTLEVDIETADPTAGTATTIRATLDAMPPSVALDLSDGPDGRAFDYAASGPMNRLFGDIVLTTPDGTNSFGIEVLDLPEVISLDLASTGAIEYSASSRAGQLAVTGTNPDGLFLRATTLQALLVDLPTSLSVLLGDDGALSLDTIGGDLGHLEVLATNGPTITPMPGVVGAVIHDTTDDFVVSLRLDDVTHLAVVAQPVAVEVGTAGGDVFVVQALLDGGTLIDLGDGSISVEAVIDTLPTDVTLGFGLDGGAQRLSIAGSAPIDLVTFQLAQTPSGASAPLTADLLIEDVPTQLDLSVDISGAITYTASAPVPVLAIDAVDPSGLFDRATNLGLRLDALPTGLDVALSEAGAVMIETDGGRLGRIEALATTGPDNRIPASDDGILFEDLVDRFVVFARFSNLYSGDVAQVPQPRVNLVTDGGRPLSLGLYQSEPGKPSRIPGVAYTEARLENLPDSVNLELLDGDPGTINIDYQASSTASSLSLETNAGDRWITEASISNPVPVWFRACQASDTRCANSGESTASVGSFRFLASQHTTLNVLDCARPLNANCTRSSGTKLTSIENMRIRSFGFEGNFTDCGLFGQQACGHLWANTLPDGASPSLSNAHTLRGRIFNRDGSTKLTLDFGANFKAAQRKVRFSRFPSIWPWTLSTTKTGQVSCTSGTALNVQVQLLFTLNFNGTTLLC